MYYVAGNLGFFDLICVVIIYFWLRRFYKKSLKRDADKIAEINKKYGTNLKPD